MFETQDIQNPILRANFQRVFNETKTKVDACGKLDVQLPPIPQDLIEDINYWVGISGLGFAIHARCLDSLSWYMFMIQELMNNIENIDFVVGILQSLYWSTVWALQDC